MPTRPEASPDARPATRAPGRAWLLGGIGLALGLLLAVAFYGYQENRSAVATRAAVAHTLLVLRHALALENAAIGMEASHRASLIDGGENFRRNRDDRYRLALDEAGRLRALVADNPDQVQRVDAALAQLQSREAAMLETDAIARSEGIAAARLNFRASGDGSIEPLRRTMADFRDEEDRLLAQRNQRANRGAARFDVALIYGTGLAFVVLVAAGAVLLRQLSLTERIGRRLAETNERLEFTHEASRLGAFELDLEDGRLDGNPLLAPLFGQPPGAGPASFEALLAQVHPDDRGAVRAGRDQAVATGEDWRQECRIHWPDGSLHWIWIAARARAPEGDGRRRMLGTVMDISARKRTEEDLQSLFNHSRDLICICSFDGRFLRLNPAWEKTLGHPVSDMTGQPFLSFIHPDDVEATITETRHLADGRDTVLFENRYRTRDGDWRWLLWNAAPSLDNGVIYAVARDVTERREAEQRISRLNAELTERGQALEASNRELEAFTYSVSHDLRAPLRHIDGYARMLMEDIGPGLDPEPLRFLETISSSSRRMGMLIDDLLALSRLGRKPVEARAVDMDLLLAEAWREVHPEGSPPATLEAGPMPPAHGDPALLRQVWVNLLSNAVKYSARRPGGPLVKVAAERTPTGVTFHVQDYGVGFDMRYADKLFGVFQRLHAQDQFEGTGVGLAIVQRIVGRHGGRVWARAEPGRGACFSFELPSPEEVP